MTGQRRLKLSHRLRIPVIGKPLASLRRMIWFDGAKYWWNGASVNMMLRFRNASTAPPVHSHLSGELFSMSEIGLVTLEYLGMDRR